MAGSTGKPERAGKPAKSTSRRAGAQPEGFRGTPEMLRVCAETLDILLFVLEEDDTISYLQGRGCRLVQLTPRDSGRKVWELFGTSPDLLHRIELARAGEKGPWRVIINSHVWSLNLVPERLADGSLRLQGIAENISQMHHLEQQRRWQEREMELLTTLTAEVSSNLAFADVLAALQQELKNRLNVTGLLLFQWNQLGALEFRQGWNLSEPLRQQLSDPLTGWVTEAAGRWSRARGLSPSLVFTSHYFQPSPGRIGRLLAAEGTHCRVQPIPLSVQYDLLGVLFLFSDEPMAFQREHPDFYDMLGRQISVAWKNARMYRDLQVSHERMRTLAQRIVAAQETERGWLARELHDELGQTLTCMKLSLEMAERCEGDPEQARALRREAHNSMNELLAKVRQMSLSLRPSLLDDLGLLPALAWYLDRFTQQTGISVHWTHEGIQGRRFGPEAETAAFRIIQESLTNVARHAGVDEVWVDIQGRDGLALLIEDAGRGFSTEDTSISRGLSGMGERALSLGGRFEVESAPGQGTRIEAHLPCQGKQEEKFVPPA